MKKVLFTAIAVLGFTFANAQEEATSSNGGFAKGDLFVSGAVVFGSTSQGDDKESGFELAPKLGYFMTENIAIGGKLGFSSNKAENAFGDTEDMSGFTVGAFGRYYMTPASQFSLFGEFALDYSTEENKLADYKVNTIGAGLGLGMNYFVSSNFSIEAGVAVLGYSSAKADVDGAEAENTFGFGGDWRTVSFGVNYKF